MGDRSLIAEYLMIYGRICHKHLSWHKQHEYFNKKSFLARYDPRLRPWRS